MKESLNIPNKSLFEHTVPLYNLVGKSRVNVWVNTDVPTPPPITTVTMPNNASQTGLSQNPNLARYVDLRENARRRQTLHQAKNAESTNPATIAGMGSSTDQTTIVTGK